LQFPCKEGKNRIFKVGRDKGEDKAPITACLRCARDGIENSKKENPKRQKESNRVPQTTEKHKKPYAGHQIFDRE
jgi:ribosome-binding protein aMBF1 (putative translation factor)